MPSSVAVLLTSMRSVTSIHDALTVTFISLQGTRQPVY